MPTDAASRQRRDFIRRALYNDWVGGLPIDYLYDRLRDEFDGPLISQRTFLRDLQSLRLVRRNNVNAANLPRIVRLVHIISMRSVNNGIRVVQHILAFEFNLFVPRDVVGRILLELDRNAVRLRRRRRLVRRTYTSRGVLWATHTDGWVCTT